MMVAEVVQAQPVRLQKSRTLTEDQRQKDEESEDISEERDLEGMQFCGQAGVADDHVHYGKT